MTKIEIDGDYMPWSKENNIAEAAKWLKRQVELIEAKEVLINNKQTRQTPYILQVMRGGIFDCELGIGNIGGEKNKTRPVLVLSKNDLNKGNTVVVVPLSTKYHIGHNGRPAYKNHYLLKKQRYNFLDRDSVVKFEDIRCVDVVRLRKLRGNIDEADMRRMKKCMLFLAGY